MRPFQIQCSSCSDADGGGWPKDRRRMRPQAELREEKVDTRSVQGTFVSWFRCSDGDSGGHGRGWEEDEATSRGREGLAQILLLEQI